MDWKIIITNFIGAFVLFLIWFVTALLSGWIYAKDGNYNKVILIVNLIILTGLFVAATIRSSIEILQNTSAQSTVEKIARAVKKEIAPQITRYETTKYPPDITKAKQTLINSINQFNPNQKLGDVSTIVPGYFELSADPSPNSHYSSSAVETKNIFSTNFYASIRLAAVENVQTMDFMGRDIWVCINPSWASFMIWESEQSQTVWKPIRVERNPVFNTVAIHQNGRNVSIFINNNYVDSFKKLRSPKPGPISIALKANKKNGGKMFFRDVSVWDFGVP